MELAIELLKKEIEKVSFETKHLKCDDLTWNTYEIIINQRMAHIKGLKRAIEIIKEMMGDSRMTTHSQE